MSSFSKMEFAKELGKNLLFDSSGKKSKNSFAEEEADLSSFLSLEPKRGRFVGRAAQYDPSRLYGDLYNLYGARRVRGGLLGD